MRLVPRHPWTLLLAFLLAALFWYTLALERRERISEKQLDAPVALVNVPPGLLITSEVPRTIVLHVRGPLPRLLQLDSAQTGVTIDLRGGQEGQNEIAVGTRDVTLPEGIEVLSVFPAEVSLRLERLVRRRLPVTPKVTGQPAEGYTVGGVTADPPTAMVVGPRLQMEQMAGVSTDPVSVEGVEAHVEIVTAVRSPHPLVRVEEPPMVRVQVGIIPRYGEFKGGKRS